MEDADGWFSDGEIEALIEEARPRLNAVPTDAEIDALFAEWDRLSDDKKDKLGNPEASVSVLTDSEKSLSGKGLSESGASIESDTTSSVTTLPSLSSLPTSSPPISSPSHPSSTTPTLEPASPGILKLVRTSREKFAPKTPEKPAPLKARRRITNFNPNKIPTKHRTQPAWRRLTQQDLIARHHATMNTFGPVNAFTLNLNPQIEKLARQFVREGQTEASPLQYLHRRIREELAAVGLPCEFWCVIEEAPVIDPEHRAAREAMGLPGNLRAHIHGEIICAPEDAVDVRKALRRAGGEWDDCRQFQAFLTPQPNDGWVTYVNKDEWRQQPFTKLIQHDRTSTLTGETFSATRKLSKETRDSYAHWRATENAKLRASKKGK